MKIFSSIKIKISFLVINFIVASITISSLYFYLSYSKLLKKEVQKRGNEIVRNLSYASREGVWTKNLFKELDPLILAAMTSPDVVYVAVVDETGRVLAHSDPKEKWKVYEDELTKEVIMSNKTVLSETEDSLIFGNAVKVIQKAAVISGLDIKKMPSDGAVIVKISLKELHTKTKTVLKNTILVAAGLIIIGIIFTLVFSKRITSPIYNLITATVGIGSGDLTKRVEIETKDEIGELANFFNKMTENLQKITVSRDDLIKEIAMRKKTEEELQIYKNHLEELVALRTGELAAINKELDSFTYTASHDLKEPLRGIESFSNFLLEDYSSKLDDTGKDYLKRISAAVKRMQNLIDDLLALSRISRIKNPYKSVDAGQLVKEAVKRLSPIIEEKNVQIKVDDELPFIYCDEIKMKEVFYNLISNAIKYNNNKEPVVEIGMKDDAFFVKDNGIGIKKEHFDLIFQMFKRLHGREEYGGGTGAGLAIVKKIIEDHKGKIWVESEEGKGSTFFFSIPKKL